VTRRGEVNCEVPSAWANVKCEMLNVIRLRRGIARGATDMIQHKVNIPIYFHIIAKSKITIF